ncbi:MAG: hypothetical protein JSS66_05170 [Armatimonadetes bacterium]|nr:hypothetical protein [Armatimonadota bacterium]
MKRAFQKVAEQTQAPEYLLKRFAANGTEPIEQDPYAGLKQRADANRQRMAHDDMVYGRPERPEPTREWETQRAADTYRNPRMNRVAQDAATAEDLSHRAVRRIDSGQQYETTYRPMDNLSSNQELFVTQLDAQRMVDAGTRAGNSFFDPTMAELTETIRERDDRRFAEKQLREKQQAVGNKWQAGQQGRVRREHKRVLDRWSNFDAVNGGFTRVANEREVAGRFGMVDPTEAARRDMMRQEEVEARMRRKAEIRGIEHETPAQRSRWEDDLNLSARTLQQEHTMSWLGDFFRGK